MNTTLLALAAALSGFAAAFVRLLLSPSFVLGGLFLWLGLVLKALVSPLQSLALGALTILAVSALSIFWWINSDRLLRWIGYAASFTGVTAKRSFVHAATFVGKLPLYFLTLAIALVPTIAQIYGSLSLYLFLAKISTSSEPNK